MKKLGFIVLLALPIWMSGCGKTEKKTITTASITLSEEYPMEGSNTLTGAWTVSLGDIDPASIKSARLSAIRFEMVDAVNANNLAEITVQLAASGAAMQKVALLNPVPADVTSLEPQVAADQANLASLLKQKEITLVADINLKADQDETLSLIAQLEFEIEVKQ